MFRRHLPLISASVASAAVGLLIGALIFGGGSDTDVDNASTGGASASDAGGSQEATQATPAEPQIESAVGANGTFDDRDLRKCLNSEMSTTDGTYWGQPAPADTKAVFVAGDAEIESPKRDWDRPPANLRVTVFVYKDEKAARKAEDDIPKTFAEVAAVTRHANVLVGAKVPTMPEISGPLNACLATESEAESSGTETG